LRNAINAHITLIIPKDQALSKKTCAAPIKHEKENAKTNHQFFSSKA
jgi:hypothetical protein